MRRHHKALAIVLGAAILPSLAMARPKAKAKAKPPAKKVPAPVEKPKEAAGSDEPQPFAGSATPPPAAVGSGSGSAAPPETKAEPKQPEPPADEEASSGPDVDSLRQEYLQLRDELFKSRARANAVASQLYSTKVQIKLAYTTGRYYNPAKVTIRLDGASVYENATGAIANDDNLRFEGFVAPGRHLVTFRVEATGKDDETFTSVTESQVVVKAVANKDLLVAAKARDGGNIAYEWKRSEHGNYGLAIDIGVKTLPKAGK